MSPSCHLDKVAFGQDFELWNRIHAYGQRKERNSSVLDLLLGSTNSFSAGPVVAAFARHHPLALSPPGNAGWALDLGGEKLYFGPSDSDGYL